MGTRTQLQILKAVIVTNPVQMVNSLMTVKLATQSAPHDQTVLKHIASTRPHSHIALLRGVTTPLVRTLRVRTNPVTITGSRAREP